jgi:pimeloyl-ACP methyl ester carboxylesterase
MAVRDASIFLVDGPWTHRAVAANGARFHVAELGDGPLVLLLHGFPEFWWAWRHQMVALAAAGYRAVAMDLRGYGASDKPPRGYDPFTLTADVVGVIKSLGEGNAVVVGHDWGGFLGWSTAALFPKVVRRLAVVGMPHPRRLRTGLLIDRRQLARSGYIVSFQRPWMPERELVRDDARMVEDLLRAWGGPDWPEAEAARRYRQAMQVPGTPHCSLEFYRWAIRSIPRPDGVRFAQAMKAPIQVPTLHLHGAQDGAFLPHLAQGSSQYVEAPYRWRLMDRVGHFPHEEAPERFSAELLGWLDDDEPDR